MNKMKKNFLFFFLSLACIAEGNATPFQLKDSVSFSEEAKTRAKQRLQAIKDRITKGENFNALATMYSDDPGSRNYGGCYDSIKHGVFVPEFEAAAFKLKVNEVSDIFETQYGYHIILLRARRGEEVDVCHILIIPK